MKPIRIRRERQKNHLGTFVLMAVLLTVLVYFLIEIAPLYQRAVSLGR
jgi:hypothetical protein